MRIEKLYTYSVLRIEKYYQTETDDDNSNKIEICLGRCFCNTPFDKKSGETFFGIFIAIPRSALFFFAE